MGQKIWFITGTARGLGRSIAQAALGRGDIVIGTSRNGTRALDHESGQVHVLPLELSNRDQVFSAVAQAHSPYGRIDVVVNNAGYGLIGAIEETSIEELQHVLNVNFLGAAHVTQAVLPFLREQRGVHIVNISSIAVLFRPFRHGLLRGGEICLRRNVPELAPRSSSARHTCHAGRAGSAPHRLSGRNLDPLRRPTACRLRPYCWRGPPKGPRIGRQTKGRS